MPNYVVSSNNYLTLDTHDLMVVCVFAFAVVGFLIYTKLLLSVGRKRE